MRNSGQGGWIRCGRSENRENESRAISLSCLHAALRVQRLRQVVGKARRLRPRLAKPGPHPARIHAEPHQHICNRVCHSVGAGLPRPIPDERAA